jgi:hypothetical protein
MNKNRRKNQVPDRALTSELLILPDGNILVHNLTRPMADILCELNPREYAIRARTQKAIPRASGPVPQAV